VPSLLRTQSDDRLVRLARQGHERAFEAIVERYRRPLHRECRRVLPEGRADDAVQHAFLAAWTALQRGDDVRDLRQWLYRIGRNSALNVARAPGFDYDELEESLRLTEAPHDELQRRAVMRETLAAVAALPERQREALLRTALEDTSQDEIARDLGMSHGAVRQLVHRARMAVRAAATAVVPLPIAEWLAAGSRSEPMAQRIAELAAGGASLGVAATAAKVGAVAVVAGGAITGPAVLEDRDERPQPVKREARTAPRAEARAVAAPAAAVKVHAPQRGSEVRAPRGSGRAPARRGGGEGRAPQGGGERARTESSGGSAGRGEERSAPAPAPERTPAAEPERSVSQGGDQDENENGVVRPRDQSGEQDENRDAPSGEDGGSNEDSQGGDGQGDDAEPPPAGGGPKQPLTVPAPPAKQGGRGNRQQGEVERPDGPPADDQGENESD
jgi:RNA polymerase sigma factor (sigma-70 family)